MAWYPANPVTDDRPEAVIFCGIQATGKSTFYQRRFSDTHVRLNLDMLRTRHREAVLLDACLAAKASFVVDNTNPSREERARYVSPSGDAGFRVVGYYFASRAQDALVRNATRSQNRRVPTAGVLGCLGRPERPSLAEGFDELYYVMIGAAGDFEVAPWQEAE